MMQLKNKQIVVVGLGRTGLSLVGFLVRQGAKVTAVDASIDEKVQKTAENVRAMGGQAILGPPPDHPVFASCDMVILSPGVPHTLPALEKARMKHIPVIGEIELAGRFIKTPIIAVTGTNGKSTVTVLIGEILKNAGYNVFVGGNLGTPLIDYAANSQTADWVVAEISSFQLDTIDTFRPKVSILLNITDDHLDRYEDFNAYVRSKARIFLNQTHEDMAVINGADPAVMGIFSHIRATCYIYNRPTPAANSAWIDGQTIYFCLAGGKIFSMDCADIPLKGRFNLENASAAGLAVFSLGVSESVFQNTLTRFEGLPHRVQYVATINGVHYYDDSKGTNVDAVKRALESFFSPVVLIMGGRDKGGGYEVLLPEIKRTVKHLIVMGEAADKIEAALGKKIPCTRVSHMAQAVKTASEKAAWGDTVLLSPACSSFDMYTGYAQRGDDFKQNVFQLKRAFQ